MIERLNPVEQRLFIKIGSWVFNIEGSLAGMIWGSSSQASATYFTSIGLIVTGIEKRTEMQVDLM